MPYSRLWIVPSLFALGCAVPKPLANSQLAPCEPPKIAFAVEPVTPSETHLRKFSADDLVQPCIEETNLVHLIQTFVAPRTWDSKQGTSLQQVGNEIAARHSEEVLEETELFIETLRENRTKMIEIYAQFLNLKTEHVANLEWLTPMEGGLAGVFDQVALDTLIGEWTRKGATKLSAPKLVTFHAQSGHILISSEMAYVAGYTKQASESHVTWNPIVKTAREGLILDFCAISNGQTPNSLVVNTSITVAALVDRSPNVLGVQFGPRTVELPGVFKSQFQGLFALGPSQELLVIARNPDIHDKDHPLVGVALKANWVDSIDREQAPK